MRDQDSWRAYVNGDRASLATDAAVGVPVQRIQGRPDRRVWHSQRRPWSLSRFVQSLRRDSSGYLQLLKTPDKAKSLWFGWCGGEIPIVRISMATADFRPCKHVCYASQGPNPQ